MPGMTQRHSIQDLLGQAMYAAASDNRLVLADCLAALRQHDSAQPDHVDHAVSSWLDQLVRAAWDGGWQPIDIAEYSQRKVELFQQYLLRDAIAAENRRYSAAATDDRWLGQLSDIGAQVWWHGALTIAAWTAHYGAARKVILHEVVRLAGFLSTLPRLPVLMPTPGGSAPTAAREHHNRRPHHSASSSAADHKILGRIRALLAKAESTEFPDEADALSAKAQEMMTKYSLDRALIEADDSHPADGPAARRLWVDAPYVSAKTYLVNVVAQANGCQAVTYDKLGFITVVGEEVEVDLVELLSTSLLVQASRAMLRTKRHVDRNGQSRTRSFRQSFLISYANRIGERLREAAEATQGDVSQADRERLLPVLARRDAAISAKFDELFPNVRTRRSTVSNAAGWAAGRAAADHASLHNRPAVVR